ASFSRYPPESIGGRAHDWTSARPNCKPTAFFTFSSGMVNTPLFRKVSEQLGSDAPITVSGDQMGMFLHSISRRFVVGKRLTPTLAPKSQSTPPHPPFIPFDPKVSQGIPTLRP